MSRNEHELASPLPEGSGEGKALPEPLFLAVGRVLRPHGLKGEVRVEIHTDYPERFAHHRRLYLAPAGLDGGPSAPSAYVPYALQGHRFHQGTVLLKLEGVDDRTQAETLREQWVWIPVEEAAPLEEGEHYLYQIIHMRVVTSDGEELGKVAEIIETGANYVYVVRGACGETLVPDIDEVVLDVDVKGGCMMVRLPEGLR